MPDQDRVDEIFFAALDLPDGERAGFVASTCGEDAGLRREVESLLSADESAGRFLDPPPLPPAGPDPQLGRPVGAWRIVEAIGAGGMGNVYLAERADRAFEKRVAIKLVRADLSSDDILRRFHHERCVLAALDHPNIARLVDGGVTGDGLPFFAMEYVEGDPIDVHCDRKRLGLGARLALFRSVCEAVSHAHRNLVIHRDLKPSNILVTGDGQVKLLDFGIAKVLESEPGTDAVTVPGAQAMTPRYASPEQIRGEPVTTATDVYSLGIVLYELLTGSRPYRTEGLAAREIERVVTGTEPTRASAAVASDAVVAELTGGPGILARKLSGDLDNILGMALRKAPQERYGTVEQLSEDVRRHLQGYPVVARPDTVGVHVAKFVRRNPVLVASAAAFLVLLAVATATSVTLLLRTRAAREDADVQRAAAEEVTRFLQDMLAGANPLETSRKDVTVREILDRAAEAVSKRPPGPPEVTAAVHYTLGRTYRSLAEHERARDHFRAALELRDAAGGSMDVATVMTLRNLAATHQELGESRVADSLLVRTMDDGADVLAAAPLERAEFQVELALVRQATGDWDGAEALLRDALAVTRAAERPAGAAVAARLNDLGVVLVRQGRYDDAEAGLREALAISREVHGSRSYDAAQLAQNLGWALNTAGRNAEAEAPLREALEIYGEILEADHPRMTSARMNLAHALQETGRTSEGVAILRQVVAADRRRFGPRHDRVGTDLANLALALGEDRQFAECWTLFAEARGIYEEALGPRHPWVAVTLYSEAVMRRASGDPPGAERLARRCLEIRRQALRPGHPDLANTLRLLADLRIERGAFGDAEAALREAMDVDPPGSPGRAKTEAALAKLESARG